MSNPDRAWTAEQVEAIAEDRLTNGSGSAFRMLNAYAATLRQQADHSFASPEALADWLESLHETNDDGAVTGGKWEPAQVAARAIRGMGKQAERPSSRCCGHDSDCAVHNMPAMPAGECDCSLSAPELFPGTNEALDALTIEKKDCQS